MVRKFYLKVVVIVVAIALVVSGAYAGYFHDQSIKGVYSDLTPQIFDLQNKLNSRDAQISSLNTQVASLSSQITNLEGQISTLDSQISTLDTNNAQLSQQRDALTQQLTLLRATEASLQVTIQNLQTQLNNLEAPAMDGIFTFTGGGCFFGCSATVRGAWANYGIENAREVVATLTWSYAGVFVQNNTINVGVVAGRSIGLYPDTSYTLTSQVDHLDWSFASKPTSPPVSPNIRILDDAACGVNDSNCQFSPTVYYATINGGAVVWRNDGSVSHTVTSNSTANSPSLPSFDSGVITHNGGIFSYTFTVSGTYHYYCCAIHPWMKALVIAS